MAVVRHHFLLGHLMATISQPCHQTYLREGRHAFLSCPPQAQLTACCISMGIWGKEKNKSVVVRPTSAIHMCKLRTNVLHMTLSPRWMMFWVFVRKNCAFCTACMLHWWVCNNTPVSWYCVVAVRLVCLCTYTYVTTNECCTIWHVFVYNAGCVCKHACVTGMGLAQ